MFFDEAHAPVGELDVCLDCNGWWATPDVPGLFGALRPDEWTSIVSLCEELGIDGCWRGDPRFEAAVAAQQSMPVPPLPPAHAEVDDFGPAVDQACVSKFPSCGARVRDALACERWLTRPTVGPDDPSRESKCSGLDDCLWALRAEPGPT